MGATESKMPERQLDLLKQRYHESCKMNHEFHAMLMEKLRVEGWNALDTWANMTREEQNQFKLKMRLLKDIQHKIKSERNALATALNKHGIPTVIYA
jgi:hypothetical protein